ncbi:hypothetical protein SAY86_027529 [Trapa natans]|uniref:Uncharacterized protein n=1 Tax=Trapa natans TaxID=22666 RepID=A0AAN7KQZ3_TRANT|nr:hypothetical protein SAY86_027529 [Trapa natans]
MEVEHPSAESRTMTFDEASMERSKGFVKSLQELKNLRPQLYSAAEYCEKSYLHSERQQMVQDNLKDYTVQALVNAVDHLGTVAYKLTDLLEQQSLDVMVMQLKVTSLNQHCLTCQTFSEKGLRQQQLLAIMPRHHKHYILPNSVNKKVHFSPEKQDVRQNYLRDGSRLQPSCAPASKTLSWHLASEMKSSLKGSRNASTISTEDSAKITEVFHLLNDEGNFRGRSSAPHLILQTELATSGAFVPKDGAPHRDSVDGTRQLPAFRSFDNLNRRAIVQAPARSRSMLSAFFAKPKTTKLRPAVLEPLSIYRIDR